MLALQILVDGFAISALYGLGAVGFTLMFGVCGVLNLAHGGIMVIAALIGWWVAADYGAGPYGGAAIGVLAGVIASFVTYYAVIRPVQRSKVIPKVEEEIFILTATLLWGIMLQVGLNYLFSNNPISIQPLLPGVVSIFGVRTPWNEVLIAILCWGFIGLLSLFVNCTGIGKQILAASINPRALTLLGYDLDRIYLIVWAIYGVLAGLAGVLLASFLGASADNAGALTASAFTIVILGGLGSVPGSLIAAYIVGYAETITAYLIAPTLRPIPALLILVIVIYLRPQGLFGAALMLSRPARIAVIVVLLVAGASAPLWLDSYYVGIFTTAYYFGVFAMSWDLLFGFAGEVNFGPTFLIGLGAYGAGLMNNHGLPIPVCLIGGAVIAVIGGIVLAVPALRLRGPYFGLVTLVAVLLLLDFIVIFAAQTGGEIGMMVPDVLSVSTNVNYWYAFGFLVISGVILFGLSRSALGLILQATGQDRVEAQALGFNVTKHKIAAFSISALFSGLAGAMMTFYQGTASVDQMVDLGIAVQIIIAVVFGGRRTILGGVLGAIFLVLFDEILRPIGQLNTFVVSGIALVVILFLPDGVLGWVLRPREER